MKSATAIIASLLAATHAAAQVKPISFVACPIVRDVEIAPCWLADYGGKRYYLGAQQDLQDPFFPPQFMHKALVEGKPTGEMKCGGIVLEPVKVSTMQELDPACNQMLPAEGYRLDGLRRGVGPDPTELSAINQRRARQTTTYEAPFAEKSFDIFFEFGDDYMPSRSTRIVTEAMRFATASKARKVVVTGYRGAAKLSDGTRLVEKPEVVQSRVDYVKLGLIDIGVPEERLTVKLMSKPEAVNGVDDYKTRRVTIDITP